MVVPGLEICHGAPFDEDYYVFEPGDAARAMDTATERFCLFGHTHLPALFATSEDPDPRRRSRQRAICTCPTPGRR